MSEYGYTKAVCAGFMGLCDNCYDEIKGIPAAYWIMTLPRGNRKYCSRKCLETDPKFNEAKDWT